MWRIGIAKRSPDGPVHSVKGPLLACRVPGAHPCTSRVYVRARVRGRFWTRTPKDHQNSVICQQWARQSYGHLQVPRAEGTNVFVRVPFFLASLPSLVFNDRCVFGFCFRDFSLHHNKNTYTYTCYLYIYILERLRIRIFDGHYFFFLYYHNSLFILFGFVFFRVLWFSKLFLLDCVREN
jgi:hypothetical protein